MDLRLAKAARLGDVDALDSLLVEDPLILEKVALSPSSETPLHIASLAGKTEFVKKILSLKPSFAWEVNPDGFSPLHIASASGYIDIVRELLKLGPQLCLLKDRDGRNPLHLAAIKGRVNVILELISCCPSAVKQVTTQGESPLHLAVKSKQFEALKIFVEKLEDDDYNGELVNAKDKQGNTILQLAVASRQLQAIELLRNESKVEKDMDIIEVGSASGGQSDVGGGAEAKSQENQTNKETTKSEWKQSIWEEVQEMVLVVASLIATVTYQAGLSPPQTIWKQDMKLDSKCISHHHNHHSSSHSCPDVAYFLFMSFNSAGFFASVFLIFFFRNPSYVQVLLPIALVSMMITYVTLSVKMSPDGLTLFIIYLITLGIFLYCVLAVELVKNILHRIYGFTAGKVSGMAKALVKKRKQQQKPDSTSVDTSKLDA